MLSLGVCTSGLEHLTAYMLLLFFSLIGLRFEIKFVSRKSKPHKCEISFIASLGISCQCEVFTEPPGWGLKRRPGGGSGL